MSAAKDLKKAQRDILLVEYQKAQDSAQFFDGLVWTTSGIILSGMLVLLGLSLQNLGDLQLSPVNLLVGLLGLFLTVFLWFLQSSFRSIKNQKYSRCKVIEGLLGMKQHSSLVYRDGSQTFVYRLVLILIGVLWLLALLTAFDLSPRLPWWPKRAPWL